MNWKIEIDVQFKRKNGVGDRKKITVEIDSSKIGIIANQKKRTSSCKTTGWWAFSEW